MYSSPLEGLSVEKIVWRFGPLVSLALTLAAMVTGRHSVNMAGIGTGTDKDTGE